MAVVGEPRGWSLLIKLSSKGVSGDLVFTIIPCGVSFFRLE